MTGTEQGPLTGGELDAIDAWWRAANYLSHAVPETPGSVHEGGELGYALVHAYGAAFGHPELVVACVIGGLEALTFTAGVGERTRPRSGRAPWTASVSSAWARPEGNAAGPVTGKSGGRTPRSGAW